VIRRALRPLAALLLGLFALLPVANWVPGGHAASFYGPLLDEWWSGSLIVLGVGVMLALLSVRAPNLWRDGWWSATTGRLALLSPGRLALVAAAATALYAIVSQLILDASPLLIDEIIQVWQGRVYASGRLAVPSTGHPELFGAMHLVDHGGQVFGQFPAGGPAMLALGSLFGVEWLVGPVFAGLAVWGWGVTVRQVEGTTPVATNALLLFALAPFAVFMSASHMNHVTSVAWIVLGMAGLALVTTSERPRPALALLLGLAYGMAGSIRPVDALAFGAPAGLWLFVRALRDRSRIGECVLTAVGMAIPLGAMLWVNAATTGHPLQFGYTLLWGSGHELGFHDAPWGDPHTPLRGLELINLYLLHLQSFFLESSIPGLLPALLVLALGRTLRPFDRYLLTAGAFLLGLYWAYWHNGFYLGPRFLYPLLPLLALWTARTGSTLIERWGQGSLPHRIWVYSASVALLLAIGLNIPLRAKQYSNAFLTARWSPATAAEAAGARDALVFVRESWGAQTLARMWGVGMARSEADFVYQRADMCRMEETLTALEAARADGQVASVALLALTADSLRVVDSALSTDHTENMVPGTRYGSRCLSRLRDDYRGFTLFPPFMLEDRWGNVYARDLHARDTIALARYPDRPVFLAVPDDTTLGALPRYHPVRRDSLRAAWGLAADTVAPVRVRGGPR
jgi:hypothetical protein